MKGQTGQAKALGRPVRRNIPQLVSPPAPGSTAGLPTVATSSQRVRELEDAAQEDLPSGHRAEALEKDSAGTNGRFTAWNQ